MRDPKTYRAFRRNEPGNFVRLSGESFKKPFEDKSRYETPSKNERYWENRRRKNRAADKAQTEYVAAVDAALD